MVEVTWSQLAVRGLEEIAEYIALDKPSVAHKLVKTVLADVKSLSSFPQMGVQMRGSSYRQLIIKPCRVIYRVTDKQIFIVAVIRSERLVSKYLDLSN